MHQLRGSAHRQELLWKEFFKDPSKWWDKRSRKRRPGQPDFRHKLTRKPLWMEGRDNPPWVSDELLRCGFSVEGWSIEMMRNLRDADVFPPSVIWTCCKNKDLRTGTAIHVELQKKGFLDSPHLDALVCMYANCGELQKARSLLDLHKGRNVVAWTSLIAGYSKQGKGHDALDCFDQMKRMAVVPNEVTFSCILKACGMTGALNKGKRVHHEILRQGLLEHNVVLGGALIDMYAKCSAFQQAQDVLEELSLRNTVCWNAIISGYAQNGESQKALDCFQRMQCDGVIPNQVTYACILKLCAVIGAADQGKKVHDEISSQGLLECDLVLSSALVDMYTKCGQLYNAQNVLMNIPCHKVVSWGSLIAGYGQNGQDQHALDCFVKMHHESNVVVKV